MTSANLVLLLTQTEDGGDYIKEHEYNWILNEDYLAFRCSDSELEKSFKTYFFFHKTFLQYRSCKAFNSV